MRPVLFDMFGFEIPTHEFFVGLGVVVAGVIYLSEARRRGRLSEQTLWIAVGAMIGGAVFAKVGSAWRFASEADSLSELYLYGGRSILGGLAGAYFGAIITKRIVGYRSSTGDLFAPAIALGLAVGRIGCFLTEQLGTPTTLPWGISVDPSVEIANCPQCVEGVAMHPSFLYESLFLGAAFVTLWALRDRLPVEGLTFKLFLLGYALFRFAVEFVRGNPDMVMGLSGSQVFLLVSIPLLTWNIARSLPRSVPSPAVGVGA